MIWLHNVLEMRFNANMDIKTVADSETLIFLHSEREDGWCSRFLVF